MKYQKNYYKHFPHDQIIARIDELTDQNVDRFKQYNNVRFIDIAKGEQYQF